jgi:wobble nucleotide-excising tRNase
MITRFLSICNFGSFTDFDWNQVVRDKGDNIVDCAKLNILYGRNYSGKTTLSRILDSVDKCCLPEDYSSGSFQISHTTCGNISESDLEGETFKTKVYNTDFVKNNLGLLHDKNGEITPFAIVGEKNVEIDKKIDALNQDIGDEKSGLTKLFLEAQTSQNETVKKHNEADKALQSQLRDKARDIKNSTSLYNDPNYKITSIKNDIQVTKKDDYSLSDDKRTELIQTVNETSKAEISPITIRTPNYSNLLSEASSLLSREVKPSKSIQELLADTELQEWVRSGTSLHRDKRATCAFCGGKLPEDLWDKIDSHFSKDSEELRESIEEVCSQIEDEIKLFKPKVTVPAIAVYAQLSEKIDSQVGQCNNSLKEYIKALKHLNSALQARLKNIFTPATYQSQLETIDQVVTSQKGVNNLIEENNQITTNLSTQKSKARRLLRLDVVQSFLDAIEYDQKTAKINTLADAVETKTQETKQLEADLKLKKDEIKALKNELSDERKGAAKVNSFLNHNFGHKSLELVPEEGFEGSKFALKRDGEPASNLSEGECSLVAFCYFMAKLHEVGSEVEDSIIWIDDPISSLDNNHIFFIFSLIESQLAKEKKYGQLFISTHNLDFLKYLKKMTSPSRTEGGKRYFIIENDNQCSRILPMPKYLERYTTEFNYLFDTIYQCSTQPADEEAQFDYYYNFGNNLRKFLESYLFYKYPNQEPLIDKIDKFFEPDHESTALINRLVNEYSHLLEAVDRGTRPIDVPEMKKVAEYVLETVKAQDEPQYNALMTSIDAPITA